MTDEPEKPDDFRRRLEANKQEMYRLWAEAVARQNPWAQKPPAPKREPSGEQAGFSEAIEKQAATLLKDSDPERESAKLMEKHYVEALDEALDKRDFNAARHAAQELSSYRKDLELLNKPKDHFARVTFERRRAEEVAKGRSPSR